MNLNPASLDHCPYSYSVHDSSLLQMIELCSFLESGTRQLQAKSHPWDSEGRVFCQSGLFIAGPVRFRLNWQPVSPPASPTLRGWKSPMNKRRLFGYACYATPLFFHKVQSRSLLAKNKHSY